MINNNTNSSGVKYRIATLTKEKVYREKKIYKGKHSNISCYVGIAVYITC